jgi:biopolymer transport protein ExbD
MAIHKAGPRLYRSVPFKHLAKGGAHGTARSSNVALNLTPFVDMMTILVTFLLIVFSTSGELIKAQKGLELPKARPQGEAARRADHHDHEE